MKVTIYVTVVSAIAVGLVLVASVLSDRSLKRQQNGDTKDRAEIDPNGIE